MNMMGTIVFCLLAVTAALVGFGGWAGTFVPVAKCLTPLFVAMFIGMIIYSLIEGRRPPPPIP